MIMFFLLCIRSSEVLGEKRKNTGQRLSGGVATETTQGRSMGTLKLLDSGPSVQMRFFKVWRCVEVFLLLVTEAQNL